MFPGQNIGKLLRNAPKVRDRLVYLLCFLVGLICLLFIPGEASLFEDAVKKFGKEFTDIQQEYVSVPLWLANYETVFDLVQDF